MKAKAIFAVLLSMTILSGNLTATVAAAEADGASSFAQRLSEKYSEPDIKNRTEVRWWMGEGLHTDETLKEEIQAIYDAGFRGFELCQLNDSNVDATKYGYGSEQWNHDFHLVLNTALDLGMTLGLTSGTNWSTANIPGLDPDSQEANQCIFETDEILEPGQSRTGEIPSTVSVESWGETKEVAVREKAKFVGAYAYKLKDDNTIDSSTMIDLTSQVVPAEGSNIGSLEYQAPEDGKYLIAYYWQQGTAQEASPAVEPSMCINYFDKRGVEALKAYWEENVLNDEELNEKIKNGDVQLFMDSLEFNAGDGITNWSEDFKEEFQNRKGYDFTPYLILAKGLPNLWTWEEDSKIEGTYLLDDEKLGQKVMNDLFDVQTQLYRENMLEPFKEWLNSYGIKLRMQASYGKYLEVSEAMMDVDYPETENRVFRNQAEMYRLMTGGPHLQNKVLSSETGGLNNSAYSYSYQRHLQEAYTQYAVGINRMVWHIWAAEYGSDVPEGTEVSEGGFFGPVAMSWPGYEGGMASFYKFGTREPSSTEYQEFNDHLGRVQGFLQEGKARVDVGMPYIKYDQHLVDAIPDLETQGNWLKEHESMFFDSTELQDNGYTYDYFSPDFLEAEEVSYNEETGTLELAGYKAIVLWQDKLTTEGAEALLDYAKQGLKVVIVDGAAVETPYNDGGEEVLAATLAEMKKLPTVATAATADDVMEALQSLGVEPYVAFEESNQQLLTQTRQDEAGNKYVYVYNYCDGATHNESNAEHGDSIETEIKVEGTFIPYEIDAWSGETTELAEYRHEDGKTVIPVNLDYGNIALYAFEAVEQAPYHLEETDAKETRMTEQGPALVLTETGTYHVTDSKGVSHEISADIPGSYDITNWDLTVESWNEGEKVTREETLEGSDLHTVEYGYETAKKDINVKLDTLATWDQIPEIGKEISGKGTYTATFQWDANTDGAYLDLGKTEESMQVFINDVKTADINMNHPIVDISSLLQEGENTIRIEYSSNLTNVQLSRGVISEETVVHDYEGYDISYRSYGPSKAVIVPYAVEEIVES